MAASFRLSRLQQDNRRQIVQALPHRGRPLNSVTKFKSANVITIGGYIGQSGGIYPWRSVRWLNEQLKATVRAGKMALVVSHYAPWHGTDGKFVHRPANQKAVYGVCQSYPNVVFMCGHEHRFEQDTRHFTAHYTYGTYAQATRTPFKRNGIDAKKVKYRVHLLCLNSVSRVRGAVKGYVARDRRSWAYLLKSSDEGEFAFVERDLTRNRTVGKTVFEQERSSVTIAVSGLPLGKSAAVRGRFSDGGIHGGIASGSVVRVRTGKKKRITGIPQGVLVVASVKKAPEGYEALNRQHVEVTKKPSSVTLSLKRTRSAVPFSRQADGLRAGVPANDIGQ